MWSYKTVISFETAVKLTPYCKNSPTLCWLFLKTYGIFKYFIMIRDNLFWIMFGFLITSIIAYKLWKRYKQIQKRDEEFLLEQKLSQLRFEESLNELLAAQLKNEEGERIYEEPGTLSEQAVDTPNEPEQSEQPVLQKDGSETAILNTFNCAMQLKQDVKLKTSAHRRSTGHGAKPLPKWRP